MVMVVMFGIVYLRNSKHFYWNTGRYITPLLPFHKTLPMILISNLLSLELGLYVSGWLTPNYFTKSVFL